MRTRAEKRAPLPGDELVERPGWASTRALTIPAPPEAVWPWVVQMGFPTHRAGWYTPHWLDRLMWRIGARSAESIRPELQDLGVGDRIPDSDDWSAYFHVTQVDPPHALVLFSTRHVLAPYEHLRFSWAFVLRPVPEGTRMVVRARTSYDPVWPRPLVWLFMRLVMGPGDWLNVTVMLHGIRRRVERQSALSAERSRDAVSSGA